LALPLTGQRLPRGGSEELRAPDRAVLTVEDVTAALASTEVDQLDRRVHAHGLRHTYAAELARERTPINVIRDALGHTSLAVTDRYLRDVAPMHVIDTIRARRWDST